MKATLARARQIFQLRSRQRSRYARRPPPTALRLIGGLAGMILLGTVLLALPGMSTDGRLTLNEALFTATSALSVTGLSVIVPSQDLTLLGQIVLLFLIQIGGVGFMVAAVVIFWVLGRKVSLIDRLTLKDSLGLIAPGAILKLTRRVLVTVLAIEGVGALLLWLHWRDQLGDERAVFYAIFHAVSAFCNAGFDLFNGLEAFPQGIPNDDFSLLVMATLIFLGGLGIPVLADLLTWHRERRISLHTRITLVVIVLLVCAGGLGIFLAERSAGSLLHDEPWPRQLLLGFFQSISARTAGFAGIQPFGAISEASTLLLLALMFIGAAPASMGGGITTGTFAVLGLTLWGYARGESRAHVGGRSLPPQMVQKAAAVLTISLFVVTFATWLLLMTHDVALDVAVFEVISAFATCGLTLGFTAELNLLGQFIIILMMFWGRLGALTIIVALAAQSKTSPLVSYPEESILIG
jgi:trk system potassium uptake protein TrkH